MYFHNDVSLVRYHNYMIESHDPDGGGKFQRYDIPVII